GVCVPRPADVWRVDAAVFSRAGIPAGHGGLDVAVFDPGIWRIFGNNDPRREPGPTFTLRRGDRAGFNDPHHALRRRVGYKSLRGSQEVRNPGKRIIDVSRTAAPLWSEVKQQLLFVLQVS